MAGRRPTDPSSNSCEPFDLLLLGASPRADYCERAIAVEKSRDDISGTGIRALEVRICNVRLNAGDPRVGRKLIIIANLAGADKSI
jgi:hypothetical protein